MEGFDGVFLDWFHFGESLVVVEVDQIGGPVVLTSLLAFGAVPGEVSYFSALEAGVGRVGGGCVALEVTLWTVSLVLVGVLLSPKVIASVIPSVVPSGWCPVPIYVHWDWGVVHPAGSIR